MSSPTGWLKPRAIVMFAGAFGFTAVALGAVGAHGLEGMLEGVPEAAERLGWWETGARLHLAHALALFGVGWLRSSASGRAPDVAAVAIALGVGVFSGSLYPMALGGPRWLGAVTPIGGVALLVGWGAVIAAARALPSRPG